MDKDNDIHDDQALKALFSAAALSRPKPSESFLRALTEDAEAAVPVPANIAPMRRRRASLFSLRGLFAASGLSGAAVLGLWIGFMMPEYLAPLASTDDTISLYTFMPGADLTAALSE